MKDIIRRHEDDRAFLLQGNGKSESERPYNVGAMRTANIENDKPRPYNKEEGMLDSERPDNARAVQIKPMKDTTTNKTASATKPEEATEVKRSKANYDLVNGTILGHINSNEGVHLNGLCDIFGTVMSDKKTPNPKGLWKFTVIYASVNKLKKAGAIFATGAKKNQGLYLTEKAAKDNTPEPTVRAKRTKDSPYVLEKETAKGWRAIEGGDNKEPILKAFETASTVPGTMFRVVDNVTGPEPKVLKQTLKAKEPVKAAVKEPAKAVKEPAKAVKS